MSFDCLDTNTSLEGVESLSSSDGRQDMMDSNQSSQNICFDSDWNSNQLLSPDVKQTDHKLLDDSFFEQYTNIKDNVNKDYYRKNNLSPASSPTAIYGTTLHQKDLSYDDLSKNIDANLAEIDMETFRSEDINSILALPAIYSGDFQSEDHGEQCASVSGSLLNGLEMDSSTSNRHSEDEISICKDEPLFSPLREPPVQATISVDSLDNSSSYEQDLVLTCKANKNNYTIVFEGSSTQFSDDSDYQDVCRSSEGEGSLSGTVQMSSTFKKQSTMAQSDVAFTTWSKLWKSHRVNSRRRSSSVSDSSTKISSKSQSLPNLCHNSVFITDKQLNQWAKWCGNHRIPIYEIVQNYQASAVQKECLHSVSLLKLFMKHKVSSNSSIGSSGQSDSSTSLILQPVNFRNTSLQNSLNISEKVKPLQRTQDDTTQTKEKCGLNDNDTRHIVDNITDWNSLQEANNNNINSLFNTDNLPDNNNLEDTRNIGNEDCDNSQYFEDSLMDVPSPPHKHFHATPIKEEEETDVSSGDEVMRDSKNPFGSDDSSSGEITVIQNNTLDQTSHRQEAGLSLERINNIFPTNKSNIVGKAYTLHREDVSLRKLGNPCENHSQSTQTKQFNINDCPGTEAFRPLHTFSCKTSSNQTDCETINAVQHAASRDSSPASSGYVSSRHSSVERLKHSSQANVLNHAPATGPVQKSNVMMTTTCTCGTQIPVHVKDSSVQTSTLNSASSSGFTFKESTTILPEPNQFSQTAVKSPLQSYSSQMKQRQKEKKSVYVCYPNYSLPDLSFLKSVVEENSESVFLTPFEYKLPQDIINQKRPSRPKSYGAYESLLQKHMTKIKDWDSLNVLLPDDLKILISKTQGKDMKMEGAIPKVSSPFRNIPPTMSSSYCNVDDNTKLKSNFMDPSYKKHMPRSILRKSSSVEQCEDRQCHMHLPMRCTSASSVMCCGKGGKSPDRDSSLHYKPHICEGFPQCVFEGLKDDNTFELKGEGQSVDGHGNCLHGKKAVKFCERSPTKNSRQLDACKSGRCCSCDTQSRSSESDRPLPQEFMVSPTQNNFMYPDISDSYTLQNFSGGGKFFQEALKRKTGLVENLRKAVQIIFEHHKNSTKKGVDLSYSMGQKILTWLCPAVHTILSDGLLPSVQGFFGPLPNSPWKVAGASIKQGETRKEVEDLLNHVTSEKLLTDSTYRFNAFILGLLNLGSFEWWLGHLCGCQSLICHHYHPTALLSLLALPAAVHLRHELKELVSPLSTLNFNLDINLETKMTSGENWKKYDEGNFRPSGTECHMDGKHPKEFEDRNAMALNLQSSPQKGNKVNDFSLKNKHAAITCNNQMNIRGEADEYHGNQVWPGITINPFPNAKFAEELTGTSHSKRERNHGGRPREIEQHSRRNDHHHFSLCSSADSGCSSQIDHTNQLAATAAADESPSVDVKEGQQFRMLKQKWEKISHGINKQATVKSPSTPKAAATKQTIASSSKTRKKPEVSPPRLTKDSSVPKTPTKTFPQTPPARRASQGRQSTTFAGVTNEMRLQSPPDVVPSSEVADKRKSQIPTLKFTKHPKSMIPVQKVGLRARSANRDVRFSSD